jgi:hypothetical protein
MKNQRIIVVGLKRKRWSQVFLEGKCKCGLCNRNRSKKIILESLGFQNPHISGFNIIELNHIGAASKIS